MKISGFSLPTQQIIFKKIHKFIKNRNVKSIFFYYFQNLKITCHYNYLTILLSMKRRTLSLDPFFGDRNDI